MAGNSAERIAREDEMIAQIEGQNRRDVSGGLIERRSQVERRDGGE